MWNHCEGLDRDSWPWTFCLCWKTTNQQQGCSCLKELLSCSEEPAGYCKGYWGFSHLHSLLPPAVHVEERANSLLDWASFLPGAVSWFRFLMKLEGFVPGQWCSVCGHDLTWMGKCPSPGGEQFNWFPTEMATHDHLVLWLHSWKSYIPHDVAFLSVTF